MVNGPDEVQLFVPPPLAAPTTAGKFIDTAAGSMDAVFQDFVLDPANAGADPGSTTAGRRNRLSFPVSIGATQRLLTIAPSALPGLLIQRYCTGGWEAVSRLGSEAFAYYFNLTTPAYRWPRDSRGMPVPPPPRVDADQFIKAYTTARARLDALVSETLAQIHAEAWRIALAAIKMKIDQCKSDLKRYFDDPLGEGAQSLNESMKRLVAAANAFITWRAAQSFERDPPEGSAGRSAGTIPETDRQASIDKETAPLKQELEAALIEATTPPRNHLIAAALLGMIFAASPTTVQEPEEPEVLALARTHLTRTISLLFPAMPDTEPAGNFRAALDRPTGRRTQAVDAPAGASFEDSLEFRAAIWVADTIKQYPYHPLNDEAQIVSLLKSQANVLQSAGNDDIAAGIAAFRYRTLAGYLAAWQNAKLLLDLEQTEDHPVVEFVNRAAGIIDLISLKVPVFQGPARLLAAASLVAQLLVQILDVPEQQRAADRSAIGPLLRDQYSLYIHILAKRPTVLSVCVDFGVHTLAGLAGFSALEKANRKLALSLRILGDVSPWLIPAATIALQALLNENAAQAVAQ